MKNKLKRKGYDPALMPRIGYCKRHPIVYLNLLPIIVENEGCFHVRCMDCGSNNMDGKFKTPQMAIIDWNENEAAK